MSEAVLGPKSAKYRVFCGYTWKTPVYLENTWVSCRFPQFCPRFCPRPALRLRETREFPEGNSRETEWSTKHPLVSLETSGNAKCWGPSGFPLGCRKPSERPSRALAAASGRCTTRKVTYRAHCWTLAADLRSSRRAGISTGRQREHDWRPRSQQCCADTYRSGQCAKLPHAAFQRPSARRLLDGHVVSVYRDAPGYQVNRRYNAE